MPSQFGMILTRFYPQHYSLALSIPPPHPSYTALHDLPTSYTALHDLPPAVQPCTIYPQHLSGFSFCSLLQPHAPLTMPEMHSRPLPCSLSVTRLLQILIRFILYLLNPFLKVP